jgi:cytoskeleton protein RodZ
MGDLGQRLKREREAKGVSLNEIAQKTRIGVRLLKAIEEEEFDQLPGGIFNKSFIQQYAEYLGIDEKQAIRDYLRASAATREVEVPEPAPRSSAPTFASSGFALGLMLSIAGTALIALIAWLVVPRLVLPQRSQVTTENAPAAAVSGSPTAVADTEPESQLSVPAPSASVVEEEAETHQANVESIPETPLPRLEASAPPSPAELLTNSRERELLAGELPEELLLQISARSTVWISITADGETEWQGLMQANQSRSVQAVETIRLTVGNAAGVELTLNGEDLGSLGREGEVKTVTLAARALREVIP